MKRILLSVFCLLALVSYAGAETYTHTFAKGELSKTAGTVTLSNVDWDATEATYIGWDSNETAKGIQIGSGNSPAESYSLTTSAFAAYKVTSVTVNTSTASNGDAKMTISVGDAASEEYALTKSATDYTFECDAQGDIVIAWNCTVKAYYVKSITVEYELAGDAVSKPTFSVEPGTYYDEFPVVALDCATEDAIILYTTDGTDPVATSSVYSEAITLGYGETVIKAKAVSSDWSKESAVTTAEYSVQVAYPAFSPEPGVYADKQTVTIETTNQTAVVYYTTDGSEPDYNDTTGATKTTRYYVAYPTITENTTFKAVAVLKDGDNVYVSKTVSAEFIVSPTTPFKPVTEIVSGNSYVIAADGLAAIPLDATYKYGYLYTSEVEDYETYVETVAHNAFTFTAAEEGYTIQDAFGRYLYMSGTYTSFNVSATMPESGAIWDVTFNDDGTANIVNIEKSSTVYYSTQYTSYGCYPATKVTDAMVLPSLYLQVEYPTAEITPANNIELDSFQTITITCPQGIAPDGKFTAVATDYNTISVDLTFTQVDANTITLTAPEPIVGNMTFWVQFSGMLLMDPDGLAVPLTLSTRTYTVKQAVEAATITSVSPADGASVETLSYILFTFSGYPGTPTDDEAKQPTLVSDNGEYVFSLSYTQKSEDGNSYIGMQQMALAVEQLTASNGEGFYPPKGSYTLTVPTGYFIDSYGNEIEGITLKYVVTVGSSIADVVAEGENGWVVYNITGVKVMETTDAAQLSTLPKGLYIINGVKTIVK